MTIDLNHLTAAAALPVLLLVGVGLIPFTFGQRGVSSELKHYSAGMFIVFSSALLSALYWDLISPAMQEGRPAAWASWMEIVGHREGPNAVRNSMFLWGGLHILHAMRLMIPEADRPYWPMWKAPFYPRGFLPWKIALMMKRRRERE